MIWSTRVQYCGGPPRRMVWSRCSPSGSCQATSCPPSLSTDHSASRGSARPRGCRSAGTPSQPPLGSARLPARRT
eukprot:1408032-Prymnesium_polylepis.1